MSDNLLQMCPSLDVSQTETPLWNYEKIQPIQQICNHSQEMCKQQLIRGDEVLNMCILYECLYLVMTTGEGRLGHVLRFE